MGSSLGHWRHACPAGTMRCRQGNLRSQCISASQTPRMQCNAKRHRRNHRTRSLQPNQNHSHNPTKSDPNKIEPRTKPTGKMHATKLTGIARQQLEHPINHNLAAAPSTTIHHHHYMYHNHHNHNCCYQPVRCSRWRTAAYITPVALSVLVRDHQFILVAGERHIGGTSRDGAGTRLKRDR